MNFYIHDEAAAFRLEIRGDFSSAEAKNMEAAWNTAASSIGDRALVIDVRSLTGLEPAGRALLAKWRQSGARFIAGSPLTRTLLRTIAGAEVALAAGDRASGLWRDTIDSAVKRLEDALHGRGPAPMATLTSERVCGWAGSGFVPGARLDFAGMRSFARSFARDAREFCFVQVDDRRLYTLSWEFGTAHVRELASDLCPGGLISELFAITCFVSVDCGLAIDKTIFGLRSRIPASIQRLADPLARRWRTRSLLADLHRAVKGIGARAPDQPSATDFEPVFVDSKACDPRFQRAPGNS